MNYLRKNSVIQIALLLMALLGLVWVAWLSIGSISDPTILETEGEVEMVTPLPVILTSVVAPSTANSTTITLDDKATPSLTTSPQPSLPTPTVSPTPILLTHTVQAGEVLIHIAATYNSTVAEIMQINDISDPTRLQIGQELLIPVTNTPTPVAPPPTVPLPSPTPTPLTYTIQAGDTLLAIAAEYSTTTEALMLENELTNPRALQIGTVLTIPPDQSGAVESPVTIHEIVAGDTLIGVAIRYRSTLEDILAANPNIDPNTLQVGQKIVVPLTLPPLNPEADPTLLRLTLAEPSPAHLLDVGQQLFAATNEQRELNGLPPYTFAEELAVVARTHAQDMVARGYFGHYTPEGVSVRDRLQEHGLNLNWVGENIQRNTGPLEQAGSVALEWFMSSPPHRANLLHEHFDRVGVGVAEGPEGWYTLVMVFGGD